MALGRHRLCWAATSLLFFLSPLRVLADGADVDGELQTIQNQVQQLRERIGEASKRQLHDGSEAGYVTVAQATAAMDATTAAQAASKADLGAALDSAWLILCGTLVMFMHAGFACLETGCCRAKNASNVLMKNLVNLCVGSIAWWLFGWGIAYGGPYDADGKLESKVIGRAEFANGGFLTDDGSGAIKPFEEPGQSKMLAWYFQWAFCTAAATIVSGGVAERVKSPTYAIYAFVMAGFIYPMVVAWTWGYGFLSEAADVGFMDFAGSGIVHLTGGASALVGTIVLGPRMGRFENPDLFQAHHAPLVVLGTLSLWFGWYGFNCGSTLGMGDAATGALAAQVAMNTTVSAACGGMVVFALRYAITGRYDVAGLCNGILAGLVSITAGCGNMEAFCAIATGCIGGVVYQLSSMLLVKMRIDDPVDASPVHGFCGIWGVLAAAIFDWGKGFDHYHGWSGFNCMTDENGNCMDGAWFKGWSAQLMMILFIIGWATLTSGATFFVLNKTGHLRVDEATEETGIDEKMHSPQKAYSLDEGQKA